MPYLKVPIIGTGKPGVDLFRPDLPKGVDFKHVCPSNPDGSPKFADTIALVPDKHLAKIPNFAAKLMNDNEAMIEIAIRNPKFDRAIMTIPVIPGPKP